MVTCEEHPGDAVSLYCKTCEKSICLKCYFSSNTLRKGQSTHAGHQVDTSEDVSTKEKVDLFLYIILKRSSAFKCLKIIIMPYYIVASPNKSKYHNRTANANMFSITYLLSITYDSERGSGDW